MKKRISSVLCSLTLLGSILLNIPLEVNAESTKNAEFVVDGSHLTYEEYSYGTSSNPVLRGEHLMTGDSIITKTGNGKIRSEEHTSELQSQR